jgi:hypothetical protein
VSRIRAVRTAVGLGTKRASVVDEHCTAEVLTRGMGGIRGGTKARGRGTSGARADEGDFSMPQFAGIRIEPQIGLARASRRDQRASGREESGPVGRCGMQASIDRVANRGCHSLVMQTCSFDFRTTDRIYMDRSQRMSVVWQRAQRAWTVQVPSFPGVLAGSTVSIL